MPTRSGLAMPGAARKLSRYVCLLCSVRAGALKTSALGDHPRARRMAWGLGLCSAAEGAESDRAAAVREAIRHLWSGYKEIGLGVDEVRPISGGSDHFGDCGMMILDTLDTLWLAGLRDEFAEGEEWVAQMTLPPQNHAARVSFFEATIRGLGGLLSAYALSGHRVLLEKARLLGDRLLKAFPPADTRSSQVYTLYNEAWPAKYIDLHNTSDVAWEGQSTPADAGSNVLEFSYLSRATGDASYESVANSTMSELLDLSERMHQYLLPKYLGPYAYDVRATGPSVMSAFGDSYFEYLLKMYIMKRERRYLKAWKAAMEEMRATLVHTTPSGLVYIARDSGAHKLEMEHLGCFVGGMLALGSYFAPEEEKESWWLPLGINITKTCYEMYRGSPSGLSPDITEFVPGNMSSMTTPDDQHVTMTPKDKMFRLRPETLESLYWLFTITGNSTYKDWSWNIFQSINKHLRARFGFAAAADVTKIPVRLDDKEETFVGAETLKYAFLIQEPCNILPPDKYVFTTEGHPFPIV